MLNVVVKPHRQCVRANAPEMQKLFVMLKLQPQMEKLKEGPRPSVAIALVVDTSSSMRESSGTGGSKLERAIEAAHRLIDHPALTSQDQLALIQFDSNSQALFPLRPLGGKTDLHPIADRLRDFNGGTMMGLGMRNAWGELRKAPTGSVKKMLVLTDGFTFDELECRSLAEQIAKENISIVTFGIGTEYNEDLLMWVCEVSKGRPYHLRDMEEFSGYLQDQVLVAIKEVITNVRALIKTVRGVSVVSLRRVYPSIAGITIESQPYQLGNLSFDNPAVFIAELNLHERQPARVRIAQVEILYDVPVGKKADEHVMSDIVVEYTTDERQASIIDPEVMRFVQQSNVEALVSQAVEATRTGNIQQALQTLNVAQQMTQNLGNIALTKVIEKAKNELQKTGAISADMMKTIKVDARTKTILKGEG